MQVYQFVKKEAIQLEQVDRWPSPPHKKFKKRHKPSFNSQRKIENFVPCDHGGPCGNTCPCVESGDFCEKFCNCSSTCTNRFPGCKCRTPCNSGRCPCYVASRECDPDLCRTCAAHEYDMALVRCDNIAIQRRRHKKLLLGISDVAGWGVFINEEANTNDLISEYVGDMISHDEGERRGQLYDYRKCSYLFRLNDSHEVDATVHGNIIRFANHSSNGNCYVKVKMVNGDYRIGIYAQRPLQRHEEILFNYGGKFPKKKFKKTK